MIDRNEDLLDPLETQDAIDKHAGALAIAAMVDSPNACHRVASDLAMTFEESVRKMGLNADARPALALAIARHSQQLVLLTARWLDGEE